MASQGNTYILPHTYVPTHHIKQDKVLISCQNPALSKIIAVALDPGGLTDSRCMDQDVPKPWRIIMKGILNPLQPLLKYAVPNLRSVSTASVDLIDISVGKEEASGYYTVMAKDESSPESRDEEKRKRLWAKSLEWVGISEDQTVLKTALV